MNKLRWKIIRANNFLKLIHQVTIELRFQKSLAQSDLSPTWNLDIKTYYDQ